MSSLPMWPRETLLRNKDTRNKLLFCACMLCGLHAIMLLLLPFLNEVSALIKVILTQVTTMKHLEIFTLALLLKL